MTVPSVGGAVGIDGDPRRSRDIRPAHGREVRADIQALRAFAVLAVVLFHLWPDRLTGGYIGVDVFFVISGYLITGQLVRRRQTGSIGLGSFWAGRARRLLPASLLVLVVSIGLVIAYAPDTVKQQHLQSIVGSALYVENWLLAANAVDYLGHDEQPPIAQHYWSLSVEEQFYVVWPLLILLVTVGVALGSVAMRRRLITMTAIVIAASFAMSLWLTWTSAPYAYFATPSRFWEFGLGSVVALLPALHWSATARTAVALLGWAGLVGSVFWLGADTPFPGYAALLPTVSAVLVIASGPTMPLRLLDRAATMRPVQWLGDQSYGIYLWHWPLIITATAVLGRRPSFLGGVVLLALTITCAALAKRFVEDPIRFRRSRMLSSPGRVGVATALAMTVVVALAVVPIWRIDEGARQRADEIAHELSDPGSCHGASALLDAACAATLTKATASADLAPSLPGLYDDTGGAFACYDQQMSDSPSSCSFGSTRPDAVRIALTGDSHAAMLIPALRQIASANDWRIDTYVGRGCVWLDGDDDPACAARRAAVEKKLFSGDYAVVIETAWNNPSRTPAERAQTAHHLDAAWRSAATHGLKVIPIIDNPNVPQSSADCLARSKSFTIRTCAFRLDTTLGSEDPLRVAAAEIDLPTVDLSKAYCREGSCPVVLGGVVVYRDLHHLTATFSRSLAPYISVKIKSALADE